MPPALRSIREHWPIGDDPPGCAPSGAPSTLCSHIDHQLRVLLGTLREEGLLDDTVILFCGDHGDMLGDFGLWAKRLFYEGSARVPMILVGAAGDARVPAGQVDERLVGLQDVMPTLLSLAGLPVPATVEGLPMTGERRRDILYGECKEDRLATRMAHDGRHKLIWYPAGNVVQLLFDLQADPRECRDLSEAAQYALIRQRLEQALVERAWGVDRDWISAGRLTGFPAPPPPPRADRQFGGQRGLHYPQPP